MGRKEPQPSPNKIIRDITKGVTPRPSGGFTKPTPPPPPPPASKK